jgi:hypothetical protein
VFRLLQSMALAHASKVCAALPYRRGFCVVACAAFGCVPYFAIVVDAGEMIRTFVLPMKRLLELFPKGKLAVGWKMAESNLKRYAEDPEIHTFEFATKTTRWW